MGKISERKLTMYLTAEVQETLLNMAHENKMRNLKKGATRDDKIPDSMGSIIREALGEYLVKKGKKKKVRH